VSDRDSVTDLAGCRLSPVAPTVAQCDFEMATAVVKRLAPASSTTWSLLSGWYAGSPSARPLTGVGLAASEPEALAVAMPVPEVNAIVVPSGDHVGSP
jgi:hypothetical protein